MSLGIAPRTAISSRPRNLQHAHAKPIPSFPCGFATVTRQHRPARLRPVCNSSAPLHVLQIVTPKQFSEHVDHGTGLVFVDFYAEWCGPCKLVERIFYQSADALQSKASFVRVDCSHFDKPYLSSLNVRLLPTCQAYRDGKFTDEFVGARPSEFAAWLKKVAFRK